MVESVPVSIAEHHEFWCPRCRRTAGALVWLAVDLSERPDLRTVFQTPDSYHSTCRICQQLILRDAPLLVLGIGKEAPVVLACPDEILFTDDPAASAATVIEQVTRDLREEHRALPGPLLPTPFDVLITALGRDVDRDAADPELAIRSVANDRGGDAADRYGVLLRDIEGSRAQRRLNEAWAALDQASSASELEDTLRRYPELLTGDGRREPERVKTAALAAGDEAAARAMTAQLKLLESCASGDIAGAWAAYEVSVGSFFSEVLDPQIRGLREEFDTLADGDKARVVEVGEQLVSKVAELGMLPYEAEVSVRTATAYWQLPGIDRSVSLERCRVLLERALWIMDNHTNQNPEAMRVDAVMLLGVVMGERHQGDPAANQERAIGLHREALTHITQNDNGRIWAMTHTNLGLSLLERESIRTSGEDDAEPRARQEAWLTEAIDHFEQALTYRTFERNPGDWAFTMSNLALAYARRQVGDRRDYLHHAIKCYSEALRGFEAAEDVEHQAQTLGNRATAQLDLAATDQILAEERASLLTDAEQGARNAIAMIGENVKGVQAGRRWFQLGRVLAAHKRYTPDVLSTLRRALEELTPQSAPRDCRQAGIQLAELAADAGDWSVAAEAWEQAAHGAAAAVESRATREARFTEMAASVNVFRWAAYALVRIGELNKAVEILELGRARELASWLQRDVIDLQPVRDANPQLCGRFVDLRSRIETAERIGIGISDPEIVKNTEELASTIAEIRMIPDLEGFLRTPSFTELVAALAPDDTIAYPITSPRGSVWVVVRPGDRSPTTVIEMPSLTSTAVLEAMLRLDPADAESADGYLIQQQVTGPLLDDEIARMAAVLGPALMEPLALALREAGAISVCLVPIGLLGRVPLHALLWDQEDGPRCLIDDFVLSYAPSMYVRGVCHARAQARTEFARLVAVGNPLPQTDPLPYAENEAKLVGANVPATESVVLLGEAATKEAVLEAIPLASHIHLSCHGHASGDAQAFDSALSFGHDRAVSAAEILDIDLPHARLVVASACETGVIPGYDTADEALALSTVFLGAGAGGVVASLWSVDDYATSLLMVRFYEELIVTPGDPASALRTATLWLRNLSPTEEARYASRKPILECQRRQQRIARGEAGQIADFQQPTTWAAFVLTGA
jgi:CHAT domain-containing protein/tetratricopeptide (TPR) repeat protein